MNFTVAPYIHVHISLTDCSLDYEHIIEGFAFFLVLFSLKYTLPCGYVVVIVVFLLQLESDMRGTNSTTTQNSTTKKLAFLWNIWFLHESSWMWEAQCWWKGRSLHWKVIPREKHRKQTRAFFCVVVNFFSLGFVQRYNVTFGLIRCLYLCVCSLHSNLKAEKHIHRWNISVGLEYLSIFVFVFLSYVCPMP